MSHEHDPIPTECWLLHGQLSDKSPYFVRYFSKVEAFRKLIYHAKHGFNFVVTRQTREPGGIAFVDAESYAVKESP